MRKLGSPSGCCCEPAEDCRICLRLIDEETGDPIVGATVLIKAGATGTGATLANTTTDSNGEVCTTANVADGGYYRATVTIPSLWGMNAVFTQIDGQQSTPCDSIREFAFCQSRMTLCVTDCVSSAARSGLGRSPFYGGALPGTFRIGVVTFAACPTTPLYTSHYMHYFNNTSGFGYTPAGDPAAGIDGPGCYTEVFFQLRETPFTCTAMQWSWQAFTGFANACDNDGRYKPVCGNEPIACGADIDVAAPMFPLGTDWIYRPISRAPSGPDPGEDCGPVCNVALDGLVSDEHQTDCSESGLMARTLSFTALNDDDVDTIGGFVGVPITLTCSGPSGSTWQWDSGLFANSAGTISCSGGITVKFQKSRVILSVTGTGAFTISWTNSDPEPCPFPGLPTTAGQFGSFSGVGTCTPTFSEVTGTASGATVAIDGEVSE